MRRGAWMAVVVGVLAAWPAGGDRVVTAQGQPALAGQWVLNRDLSQFPKEVGFGADLLPSAAPTDSKGRGRKGTPVGEPAGINPLLVRNESQEDATRVRLLTTEVREPAARLTIVESPVAITFTGVGGVSRTLHPGGADELITLEGADVAVGSRWEAGRLVVLYKVEPGRQLRYAYSVSGTPRRLTVEVQFLEKNGHDSVIRVYDEVSTVTESAAVSESRATPPPPPGIARPPALYGTTPPPGAVGGPPPGPPGGADVPRTVTARADPLKGLRSLGLVVETGASDDKCLLGQSAIESAALASLAPTGLKVVRDRDDDSYVYVTVNSYSFGAGLCVSRYDVSIFTHTTATLSYQATPSLVQVVVLHSGGMAGGSPAAHADAVVRGVKQYIEQMGTRIRDANR